ncbi:3-dehydroquinate synthase [Bartonella bacilliformis Peru38]|uniref:3-dehydroquinate synthase n=2 Tax=Bartonella bacilliformis TaxID=774 RepID=AROB_BARBK|nr:3-dehydroquinate synthase [Bartonella bacilliformis]A1UQX3.1 RecName: Full=3-dehydroquinate synthase; Short=DHQS [Bartonella bacilliformis KC583]ABM44620.1 3-dehydroquinate synthase [Bartonella bacilliformis KC583]AMG85274.1 3-dehydroquinate synthase [Bartonella bacilliformis]EKS45935.1 3-dehydroquinate synthase [Bartonella bacilliformis INS]EYS88825.1 3-dehydroquinate synthase [Bartonella bacilliformis San Pedro600-02]KEG17998.1 3-dehydroquinate synthase [Bartonella bacilliformis Cond044]
MKAKTITVKLDKCCYDIIIGSDLIAQAALQIKSFFHQKGPHQKRLAIVTDTNVAALHLETLQAGLSANQIHTIPIIVEAGEQSKSFPVLQTIIDKILAARLERGDSIIAFGGGVIGDLGGFAASIIRRGMHFIQMPTTLLAQIDSSIGGKTGINSQYGKNLIGSFYQPQCVITDTCVLDTLPLREFRAGYAEMVKYGLINQPHFFEWLEKNQKEIFSSGPTRVEAIARSCQFKADIVARDEYEAGERALLNLGHTFGHMLETATAYNANRLIHGEAVAIGMILAYQFSAQLNLISPMLVQRVETHLKAAGLPTQLQDIPGELPNAEMLMTFIAQDKKVSNNRLTFILTHGLGQSFIAKDVASDAVLTFLKQKFTKTH